MHPKIFSNPSFCSFNSDTKSLPFTVAAHLPHRFMFLSQMIPGHPTLWVSLWNSPAGDKYVIYRLNFDRLLQGTSLQNPITQYCVSPHHLVGIYNWGESIRPSRVRPQLVFPRKASWNSLRCMNISAISLLTYFLVNAMSRVLRPTIRTKAAFSEQATQ